MKTHPDDAPPLTAEVLARAEYSVGGKVVRRARGTYTKAGRPPVGEEPKVQISLPLNSDLIDYFRGTPTGMANANERGVAEDGGDVGVLSITPNRLAQP
jgi:uncharacterized protein (DUF4415 family)